MEPKINSLSIERFRALNKLEIKGFGQVNLITGKNNSGKSSVLEAIRLLASSAPHRVISDILHSREEDAEDIAETSTPSDFEGSFLFASLFPGFPLLTPEFIR